MADPATLSMAFSIASSVASAGMSIYSGVSNANAAKAEADAINKQRAMDVAAERRKTEELLSKQQAIGVSSGLAGGTGSLLENALHEAYLGEMNAQKIDYQGRLAAYGKKQEASQYTMSSIGSGVGGLLKGASLFGDYLKGLPKTPSTSSNPLRSYSATNWNIDEMSKRYSLLR